MNLHEKLAYLAAEWLSAQHAAGKGRVSLATLGARVHKDAKLFERLGAGGSISIERYELLISYLADPESWPERVLPESARVRLASMGVVQGGERLVIERDTVERETLQTA